MAERRLQRKPIVSINLYSGRYHNNPFGMATAWVSNPVDVASIKERIFEALTYCNDFELMFNRVGGKQAEDIVPSYIWGDFQSEPQVRSDQWDALRDIFDYFELDDHNDIADMAVKAHRLRRAWFYSGGGLPLKSDGTLFTDGHMGNRVVAPATPGSYKTEILDLWPPEDNSQFPAEGRYRCLFLDAMVQVPSAFVMLCQDQAVRENYTLVAESITLDENARRGAVWFAGVGTPRAPWWNPNDEDILDVRWGYNTEWISDWATTPIYLGVQDGGYPYLRQPLGLEPPASNAGEGNNMSVSDIYRFIVKGATPVAQTRNVARRVGAAWDWASGRATVSRVTRSFPRLIRGVRF